MTPDERAARSRAFYVRHRDRLIARTIAYRERNPEKVKLSQERSKRLRWHTTICNALRGRAAARGLPFEIDSNDLLELFEKQNGRCYWLGIPLVVSTNKRDPLRPSLDRLDPTRGYTLDNIVLTCMFANLGRSTLSAEKMREFVVTHLSGLQPPKG